MFKQLKGNTNIDVFRPVGSNYRLGGGGGGTDGGHRYETFRAQMRNLLRLRYEKDGGKDMEIIWRTHVETMRGGGGGGHGCENDRRGVTSVEII